MMVQSFCERQVPIRKLTADSLVQTFTAWFVLDWKFAQYSCCQTSEEESPKQPQLIFGTIFLVEDIAT